MSPEPRFFVSELWGFAISPGAAVGTGLRETVTATIFDRAYTPPAIIESRSAGRAVGNKLTLRRVHARCDHLNATEPQDPWKEAA